MKNSQNIPEEAGVDPGQVSIENNAGTPVVRWTAPASGFYNISVLIGGTTAYEMGGYGNNFAQFASLNINLVGQTADSFSNNVKSWTFTNLWLSAGGTVDAYVPYQGVADGGDNQTIFHVDAAQTRLLAITYGNHGLTVSGATANNVSSRLYAATNLIPPIVWQPIYTNTSGGAWQFTDPNTAGSKGTFYRLSTP